MTTVVSVPMILDSETRFPACAQPGRAEEVAPRSAAVEDVPAAARTPLACVILSATCAPPPGEVAERVVSLLAPDAVNVTGLSEAEALPILHGEQAVFLVSSTDWLCLELARERARWLGHHGLGDRCGLVLWHVPGTATAEEAEDFTGVPVCALLDCDEHIQRFASWIAAEYRRLTASARAAC